MIDRNANAMSQAILRLYVSKNNGQTARFPTRSLDRKDKQYIYERGNKSYFIRKVLARAQDVEEVTDHPLLDVLQEVNGFFNGYDLNYWTGQSLEATGNAYWWLQRDPVFKQPIEIIPLQPQYVRSIASKTKLVDHYKYGSNRNDLLKLKVDDVVHFKYATISSPVLGAGPLEAGVAAADLGTSMNTYETALFRNGGTPDTLLSYPENVNVPENEKKKMERRFQSSYRGASQAGKLFIATGGAKLDPFNFSPKEMSYLGGRKWAMEELAGVYGVPISFILPDQISRANLDASIEMYMRFTIRPKLYRLEETYNQDYVSQFDENLFLAYDDPVPEDKEFRLKQTVEHLKAKYSAANEERAIDGLDPVKWGDEPVIPEPPTFNRQPEKQKTYKQALPKPEMPAANFVPTPFVRELVRYFDTQGREIMKLAGQADFKQVKAEAGDLVSSWFDMSVWDERLKDVYAPFVRASFFFAGDEAIANVSDRVFDRSSPNAVDVLARREGSIRQVNRTTQKLVRQAVADGLAEGEGAVPIRKRIQAIFSEDELSRNRAIVIARTETIWALNEGAIQAYKQAGVVEQVEWLTAADERVCEFCGPMDGTVQTLGFNFHEMGTDFEGNEGGTLQFDFEPIEHPPLHPQCRCTIIPIVSI